jgi:uncharacterized phage protein (TIGR02218 family)
MRNFSDAFADHLASHATTLATCWRLVRTDGQVLGFTDHDLPLAFDGTNFDPAIGLDGGETPARLGAQIDTGEVVGILSSDAVTEDDILLGRYDNATVETWRVDWRDTSVRALLSTTTIGEITREGGSFRAELRSAQAALNVPKGRRYQTLCDASFGDRRCGVDGTDPRYRTSAIVGSIEDRNRLVIGGLSGFDAGWFAFGAAKWTSGRRDGVDDAIVGHARLAGADILTFAGPVGDWVAEGDGLVVTAGCDRRFATCRDRFANAANFRGFPHIPGTDFVLSYPTAGSVLNGEPIVK